MPIQVAGRRRSAETLTKEFPGALIIDVTSRAAGPWVRLSPFYPHGGIPVPRSPGVTAQSVEGIWQALKVFATADVDPARLSGTRMAGIKRTVRKYGPVLGHRDGLYGNHTTNGAVSDLSRPLSHAALVGLHVQGRWPDEGHGRAGG